MWTDIIKRRQPSPYRYSRPVNSNNHAVKLFYFFKRFFRPKDERSDRMNTLYYTIEELGFAPVRNAGGVNLSSYNLERFKDSQRNLRGGRGGSLDSSGLDSLRVSVADILDYWKQLVKLFEYVDTGAIGNKDFKYELNFFDVSDAQYRDEINRHFSNLTKDDARYIAIRADRIWRSMEHKIKRTYNIKHDNRNPDTTQSEDNFPQLEGDKGKYSNVLFEEKKKKAVNRFKKAVAEYHYDDARKQAQLKEVIDLVEEVFSIEPENYNSQRLNLQGSWHKKIGNIVRQINSLLHTASYRDEISDWDVSRLENLLEEMKAEI